MKEKIETVLNRVRQDYMFMLVGRKKQDFEELLFQLDEEIRAILKEEENENSK